MTDPLRQLFEHHLPRLSASYLGSYVEFNALPPNPSWRDDTGKTWTLQERAVELVLTGAPAPTLSEVLARQCDADATDSPVKKWHQADEDERRRRVRLWLAAQRLNEAHGNAGKFLQKVEPLLRTSFARKPAGFPASGFGQVGDGGWLAYAFEELDLARQRSPASSRDWSGPALAWLDDSLLARSDGAGRWWSFGGVAGTRKSKRFPGDPGWEEDDAFFSSPGWAPFGSTARPGLLPDHWDRLTTRLIDLAADSLEQSGRFSVVERLHFLGLADQSPPGKWLTENIQKALVRLSLVGLTGKPHASHPQHRFDGRSLDALSLLVAHAPGPDWASQHQRQALARAVVDHQQAWENSPHSHERAMAPLDFSPRQTPSFAWALNQLEIELVPAASPRPPLPGWGSDRV